jgi:hypothetical protein
MGKKHFNTEQDAIASEISKRVPRFAMQESFDGGVNIPASTMHASISKEPSSLALVLCATSLYNKTA